MANTELVIGQITRVASRVLRNALTFTGHVNREYDSQFAKSGAKIGNVLNVRKPVRFTSTYGQGLQLQDLTEQSIPVVLDTQYQRAFAVTSQDLSLNIDDFRERFVDKAVFSIANDIDYNGLQLLLRISNEVGTPGTIPNSVDTYLAAGQKLNEEAAPVDNRNVVIGPAQQRTIVNGLTGLFNPQTTISAQYSKGMMTKNTVGFDWYMDQNVPVFTTGPQGGSPTVNGAAQTGSSIITNGWTAAAAKRLSKGDVITFAGCFAVNPQNRQSTNALRQFVVTADASSDGGGNLTVSISPSIVTSGTFQNCSASPTTTGAVVVQGAASITSARGVVFHPDAFIFACADLPTFKGVDQAFTAVDTQLKMSIRGIRDYDINTDRAPLRLDLLGGWNLFYQELAVRVCS